MEEEYFDNEIYEQEEKYGYERDVYERVSKDTGYISPENFKSMTDEEKFVFIVNVSFKDINNLVDKKMGYADINTMKESVYKMGDNVKYRNPIAYILGYYCTNKKRSIDKKRISEIEGIIEEFEGISPEDVLRYSNYWVKYLYPEDD